MQTERSILHVDINSCYANIEILHRPELRGKPVVVGGDVEARHGIVLAKSQEAKPFGIKTGEVILASKAEMPRLDCATSQLPFIPSFQSHDSCLIR